MHPIDLQVATTLTLYFVTDTLAARILPDFKIEMFTTLMRVFYKVRYFKIFINPLEPKHFFF